MKRFAQGSFEFEHAPSLIGYASVVGKKEGEGPIADCFDRVFQDNLLGEETWENAESRLVQEAVNICVGKTGLTAPDFDLLFSGDLLNQCIASTFGLRSLEVPYMGMYGACSTMAETLIAASAFIESGCAQRCIAATSSHFSSAERQYRMPLQYGNQRPPAAQRTVTGSGAVALSADGGRVSCKRATVGKMIDLGIKDPNNMGAAMAPSAASTIERYLHDFDIAPDELDLILTGDLGAVGSQLLLELLQKDNIDISKVHNDCGLLIFDRAGQDVHAGGSGCGCSASVLCGYILPKLESGEMKRVLFVGTGALLSPTSQLQGESVPGVAHAVELVSA